MWIGIALIVTMNAEFVTDASAFRTETECRAEQVRLETTAAQAKNVLAYYVQCVEMSKLTINKPKPSTEPPPPSTKAES